MGKLKKMLYFFFPFLYLLGINTAETSWVMWESGSSHGQSQFLTFLFSALSALGTVCVVISRFSLCMQTIGGGNDHTHTHSPLSSLLTASCRQRQGTKQHHPKGFSGSFLSVAISKSFYKWAHFGKVSAIILLGSHQMTIQLKIHVRVWSYRCSLLDFYFFLLFFCKEHKIPTGSVVLQCFYKCEARAFLAGVPKPWKVWKEIEQCFLATNALLHASVSLALTAEEKLVAKDNEVGGVFHRKHFNFSGFLLLCVHCHAGGWELPQYHPNHWTLQDGINVK